MEWQLCGACMSELRQLHCGVHQQRRSDGAFSNRHNAMRAASAIAEPSLRVECQPNAIAIRPRLGGEYGNFVRSVHSGAFQRFTQNGLLNAKLLRIAGVLIVASAARAKVRTGGSDAFRRRGDNLFNFRAGIATLVVDDAHARLLAGQCQRHKNSFALHARQECAAVNGLLNLHQQRVCVRCGHCWLM